jgi:hypothetical protein
MTPGDRSQAPQPSLEPPVRPSPSYAVVRDGPDARPTRLKSAARGIASAAGVATTLGLVVVFAPSLTEGYTGASTPSATDLQTVPPVAAADVVETPAPSPVKAATADKAVKATPRPRTTQKARAAAKPKATRQPTRMVWKPAPRPVAKPKPKPVPVPTKASGKP